MLNTTVSWLRCPSCEGKVAVRDPSESAASRVPVEIRSGVLRCETCSAEYPILAGVALLVEDPRDYVLSHAKGIARTVEPEEISGEYRAEYLDVLAELEASEGEHIEEDLEAERVNALYLMNHFLRVAETRPGEEWWKGPGSEGLVSELIEKYWDQGPLPTIGKWMGELPIEKRRSVVELGCGAGGLFHEIQSASHRTGRCESGTEFYLGVDSSFSAIVLARHLALGTPYTGELCIPSDLYRGPLARKISLLPREGVLGRADFVVADAQVLPVVPETWDVSVSLNMIDMLEDPASLPRTQAHLTKKGGIAIQSSPYIWHPAIAEALRENLSGALTDSATAVEALYQREGFSITRRETALPWLFFKHLRQLEIYSVHAFTAERIVTAKRN